MSYLSSTSICTVHLGHGIQGAKADELLLDTAANKAFVNWR